LGKVILGNSWSIVDYYCRYLNGVIVY